MNTEANKECENLRSQLSAAKTEAAEASSRASEIETRSNWELMAKDKYISEVVTKLEAATGISARTGLPIS